MQWDSKNWNYFISQGRRGLRGEVSKGGGYKGDDEDEGMENGGGRMDGGIERRRTPVGC